MKGIILAAGTRLAPLTNIMSKQPWPDTPAKKI